MKPKTKRVLYGGLMTGLIGYLTVVVLLAAFNILAGRSPFYTAALLGSNLLFGGSGTDVAVTTAPVVVYNMVHLGVFLLIGLLASWLVRLGEDFPLARYLLFFVLLAVAVHLYAMLVFFTTPLLGGSAWLQIGIPSVAAAALMGWYLLAHHPVLRRTLKDTPLGE